MKKFAWYSGMVENLMALAIAIGLALILASVGINQ